MLEYEAVMRLKQRDITALETLVRLHQLRALHAAYLILHDRRLAEDVVADAFLHAYARIEQFDANRPFGPWFLRIVINMAKRASQRNGRELSLEDIGPSHENACEWLLADMSTDLEETTEQAELRDAVSAAMSRLSPAQRAVVVQRYYLDFTEKEIAVNVDSPVGTVKWRLHSARKQLRRLLQPLVHLNPSGKRISD